MGTKDPGAALTARGVTNLNVGEIDMTNGTCSELGCDKPTLARDMCVTHYHRWNRATKDQRPAQGACVGCGATLRALKKYCGPDCRPRCSIAECEKPVQSNDMCSAHATRASRFGDPLAPKSRQRNEGNCSIEGCGEPSRKRGWCTAHYGRWRTHGDPGVTTIEQRGDKKTTRKPVRKRIVLANCLVCDKPNREGSFRSGRFCSGACQMVFSRHGGVPAHPACARCGVEINLLVAGKQGRRKRADSKLCRKCKTMHSRHWASPGELALRDGPYCQLCGCDDDLTAMAPDNMRASVDHIIPRGWGGSDDPENLQLAHLHCNHVKSDRYGGQSWRSTA